jgi:transcriptional regulator with XRE-family HTH domain
LNSILSARSSAANSELVKPFFLRRFTAASNYDRRAVQRGPRGSGLNVDPARVKRARIEAGLSLAQVSRDDVSHTFLYLVEQGRSRPSKSTLTLIARRTHKPVDYFLTGSTEAEPESQSLASDLSTMANRVRSFAAHSPLTGSEIEAMKLVEVSLRQAAVFAAAVLKESQRP